LIKSLTLDFGDFEDSYYAVETPQGNEIAQQISGYIDIILNSRRDQLKLNQNTLMIDSKKQLVISPAIKKQMGHDLLENNDKKDRESFSIKGLCDDPLIADAQRKALETIHNGFLIAQTAKSDMFVVMNSSNLNEDPNLETWKNEILSINIETMASLCAGKLSALSMIMLHATGDVYTIEYSTIVENTYVMIENLRQISQNVKVLATLFNHSESEMIIQLGKAVVESFISVLSCLKNTVLGETFMEKLFIATSQLADNISALLFFINKLGIDEEKQKQIIISAGEVAISANLIQEKMLFLPSSILDDNLLQSIQRYTHNVIETSNMLVAVTEVLSPVLDLPRCRETFFLAMILMEDSLKPPKIGKEFVSDNDIITEFMKSIEITEVKLATLIDKIKKEEAEYLDEIELLFEYAHLSTIDLLDDQTADAMLGHSKELIYQLESLAVVLDEKSQEFKTENYRLLALNDSKNISKLAEDATDVTKSAAKNWDDLDKRNSFLSFIKDIQSQLEIVAAPYMVASLMKRINLAFKNILSSTHQLISAAKSAGVSNRDQSSQISTAKHVKDISNLIPRCVQTLDLIREKPSDYVSRSVVIKEANQFNVEGQKLVDACKKTIPYISDPFAKQNLASAIKQMSSDIDELRRGCLLAMRVKGKDEINHALASLRAVQNELEIAINHTPETPAVNTTTNPIGDELRSSMNDKIKCINTYLNTFKRKDMEKSIAGETAISTISDYQNLADLSIKFFHSDLNEDSKNVLRILISVGSSLDFMLQKIQKNIKEGLPVSTDLENIVIESIITMEGLNDYLPGVQMMIQLEENLSEYLEKTSISWSAIKEPLDIALDDESVQDLENNLRQAVLASAVASSTLSKSVISDSAQMILDISNFEVSFEKFFKESMNLSKAAYDSSVRLELGGNICRVGQLAIEFVGTIKSSHISLSPDATECVSRKLRETVESIHLLLDSLTSASNSKNPFLAATKQLDEAFFLLQKANEASTQEMSFENLIQNANLEGIMISKMLATIPEINSSKEKAECIASSIKRITLANASIMSFIAASDPLTQLASPSAIDQNYFRQKKNTLKDSVERLYCENISRDLIISVAQEMARITGKIIVNLKENSKKENMNAEDRTYFSNQAREIGMNINILVESIKALAMRQTDETRESYKTAAEFLLKSMEDLASTCESSRFFKKECVLSSKVALKQRRYFDQNIAIINDARNIIEHLRKNTLEGTNSIQLLHDSVAALLMVIVKEKPLFAVFEGIRASLEKSIEIVENACVDTSEVKSGSKNLHNRKTLVDALACISNLADLILTSEDQVLDSDRITEALQNMVKYFTNNVITLIDIGQALQVYM
jgi:talin